MNRKENRKKVIDYWVQKASESLAAASDELSAGRLTFAVNRAYYACFYSVSALLLGKELRFKKHSGVRAAFWQHFVNSGLVPREFGDLYEELFEARQRGDYVELVEFERDQVEDFVNRANVFVDRISSLIA